MSKGFDLVRLLANSLTLAALAGFVGLSPGALAIDQADDVGVFGSVTVARTAREAAKALKSGDFAAATNLYRQSISNKGDFVAFYYGLLYSAMKAGQWEQVDFALQGLAEKDPGSKGHLEYETGHCYRMLNRFDEAIPHLRNALAKASVDNGFLVSKVRDLQTQTAQKAPELVPGMIDANGNVVPKPPEDIVVKAPPKRDLVTADMLNPDATDTGRDYENAFRQSEWIGICTYKGYEPKEHIGFYNPPTAKFYWTKILKGPPLNHDVPVKFKFYDHAGVKAPEGWKFGPDKMPKIGSEWLIFIPNAVPIPGVGFDTFKGDYGRQEANEKNLGEIYAIIEAHHGQI
ncbi:MAG: hypothetical protein JSS83_10505 [Cyanobacteria bacterium SZAS LIN-3]|nr:hypothetical protein [Cyanobacteria bacterium SZAS LIN-3]